MTDKLELTPISVDDIPARVGGGGHSKYQVVVDLAKTWKPGQGTKFVSSARSGVTPLKKKLEAIGCTVETRTLKDEKGKVTGTQVYAYRPKATATKSK